MIVLITIIEIVAALLVLILLVALFIKKEYIVEREIIIDKPRPDIFDYIKLIKNQDNYSVWNQLDPAMKKTYTGTDGTVGFKYAWDSINKKAGKGEQTITAVMDGGRLDTGLHFMKPFEGFAESYIITTSLTEHQTKVKWGIKGTMKYPMNIMLPIMNMDKMMGGDLESNLRNLKGIQEAR